MFELAGTANNLEIAIELSGIVAELGVIHVPAPDKKTEAFEG